MERGRGERWRREWVEVEKRERGEGKERPRNKDSKRSPKKT